MMLAAALLAFAFQGSGHPAKHAFRSGYSMALHDAVKAGNVSRARRLLDKGADPNAQGKTGYPAALNTAVIWLRGERLASMVSLLVSRGAKDVNVNRRSPLLLGATLAMADTRVLSALMKAGSRMNVVDEQTGWSPLSGAIALYIRSPLASRKTALAALALGADPNLGRVEGMPPLSCAVRWRDLVLVRALLAAGADPKAAFDTVSVDWTSRREVHKDWTALHVAARFSPNTPPQKLAELLFELRTAGADPSRKDGEGKTALDVLRTYLPQGSRTGPAMENVEALLAPHRL